MKKILFLIIALVLVLSGCKKDVAPEECIAQTNQFVEYFKAKNFDAMYEMTYNKDPYLAGTYDENSPIGQKLFNAMTENLSFEITGGSTEGKNAYVRGHIVTVDIKQLLTDVVNEYTKYCTDNADELTEERMGQALELILDENLQNLTPYEKDTSLDFIKVKGEWIIEDNVGVYDDLSGGYLTYCFGMNMAMGNTATVTD